MFNTLNAELNPICHLLALLGAHHFLYVSGIRVEYFNVPLQNLHALPSLHYLELQQAYIIQYLCKILS